MVHLLAQMMGSQSPKLLKIVYPLSDEKINDEIEDHHEHLKEIYRRIQRMTDPGYLHTLTMTDLFQTTYKSRVPVVEGLLHAGAYILAGAPKIGKSFLAAQIALPCQHWAGFVGLQSPPGNRPLSCVGG